MGSTIILLALIGVISATPMTDIRSHFLLEDPISNLDDPKYRLRDVVQPSRYHIDLDVYLSESRFNGLVQIDVSVLEANLEAIVLHQNVVEIKTITVENAAGLTVPLRIPDPFTVDNYYEIVEIHLANPIPTGNYTITITYDGQINENPIDRGFYKGYYFNGNQEVEYATTQFQPYYARKAFPCFDEPQFKSTFIISIVRDRDLSQSYSNMAIENEQDVTPTRVRETFFETPIVSAYLIAFHVSDFVATNLTGTSAKPFGIVSRPGVTNQHEYAASIGLDITNELDEYLAFNYYEMGQGRPMKNDHIALPDFPSGAMENWGMVNYREVYLLFDEQNTNLPNQIFIATIMAHELAHKWFGNLVTCFWWSNLWLNESYASFFEYFAAHMADPSLELADQFIVDYVHSALNADSANAATPMNWTGVADNPSISAHFSTTSYAKGASVLRMMEHFVGAEVFRNALRIYLSTNAYDIGTPNDMYTAFEEAVSTTSFAIDYPGISVRQVFDSYVQNPGAPVVTVDVNMSTGRINITQERYKLAGTPETHLWHIPLTWTDTGELDFSTKPKLVLTDRSHIIETAPGHRAVFFNAAQSGYYRVNYDTHNWEMIAAYLRRDRENINKFNRAQIVNDILHFVRSGHVDFSLAFNVLDFMSEETDYYVWAGALGQLDWIRRRMEYLPDVHEEFSTYLLNSMNAVIEDLGFEQRNEDTTSTILNRMQILNYACVNLKHEACTVDSLEKWNALKSSNTPVHKNYRRYVYCLGLRHGDQSDYNLLKQMYDSSENTADMVIMLRALACTTDEASLVDYLNESMNNRKIRIHDKTNAFSFALQGNPENLPIVMNFFFNNLQQISDSYGGPSRLSLAMSAFATYLTNFDDIVTFQNLVYQNQVTLAGVFNNGVAVVNSAMNNLQWANQHTVEILGLVRTRNSSAGTIATPIFLLIVTVVVNLFK